MSELSDLVTLSKLSHYQFADEASDELTMYQNLVEVAREVTTEYMGEDESVLDFLVRLHEKVKKLAAALDALKKYEH